MTLCVDDRLTKIEKGISHLAEAIYNLTIVLSTEILTRPAVPPK